MVAERLIELNTTGARNVKFAEETTYNCTSRYKLRLKQLYPFMKIVQSLSIYIFYFSRPLVITLNFVNGLLLLHNMPCFVFCSYSHVLRFFLSS